VVVDEQPTEDARQSYKLMDSRSLFLTANTSTVYVLPDIDLKGDGPIVVEAPQTPKGEESSVVRGDTASGVARLRPLETRRWIGVKTLFSLPWCL